MAPNLGRLDRKRPVAAGHAQLTVFRAHQPPWRRVPSKEHRVARRCCARSQGSTGLGIPLRAGRAHRAQRNAKSNRGCQPLWTFQAQPDKLCNRFFKQTLKPGKCWTACRPPRRLYPRSALRCEQFACGVPIGIACSAILFAICFAHITGWPSRSPKFGGG